MSARNNADVFSRPITLEFPQLASLPSDFPNSAPKPRFEFGVMVDYILTFAPAPVGDWSLIPNNNSPVREQMWAIVQNALAPKPGQATTEQRVQQPVDYSRPWAIVRLLPDLRRYIRAVRGFPV